MGAKGSETREVVRIRRYVVDVTSATSNTRANVGT